MEDLVILVDKKDSVCGSMEKYEAHMKGKLHRAFSVFVINDNRQILLQKRAVKKYHSAGLWSNTCCSHPKPGEDINLAAKRRLMEEMGFDCRLSKQFSFIYKATLNNQLTEHEFDHIFFGRYNKDPCPNPSEVAEWKWMDIQMVSNDLKKNKTTYTYWFSHIWERTIRSLDTFILPDGRTNV
ncbi:MAG: isopentenyl-diphosphate Delta-isomerase [Deltaproteobacteria bacterium]|nr:isopentenyl-diphosphate Delta-isomerase [Deltaproteobacteria bacterium]